LCYSYRSVPLLGWGLTSAFYGWALLNKNQCM
jgi:hypothetical protein